MGKWLARTASSTLIFILILEAKCLRVYLVLLQGNTHVATCKIKSYFEIYSIVVFRKDYVKHC